MLCKEQYSLWCFSLGMAFKNTPVHSVYLHITAAGTWIKLSQNERIRCSCQHKTRGGKHVWVRLWRCFFQVLDLSPGGGEDGPGEQASPEGTFSGCDRTEMLPDIHPPPRDDVIPLIEEWIYWIIQRFMLLYQCLSLLCCCYCVKR